MMLPALLEKLEKTNPRECAILRELDSIEYSLDELLISQNNTVKLNASSKPPKICLHIYNTYNAPTEVTNEGGNLHNVPRSITLHVRGYEVDDDGCILPTSEPGVLSRYFSQILVCTRDRTVMWDRKCIPQFHDIAKKRSNGWKFQPPTSFVTGLHVNRGAFETSTSDSSGESCDEETDIRYNNVSVMPYMGCDGGYTQYTDAGRPVEWDYSSTDQSSSDAEECTLNEELGSSAHYLYTSRREDDDRTHDGNLGMEGRSGDPGPYNGYEELHISQLCHGPCRATLYLFPSRYTASCTLSSRLYEFILTSNKGVPLTDASCQISLHRLMSFIIGYTYEHNLLFQGGEGTFFVIDKELSGVFDLPEGSSVAVENIASCIKSHLLPPKPIKINHNIVCTGDASRGDKYIVIQVANMVHVDGSVLLTDYDKEIEVMVKELCDLIHVRNIYEMFSTDPFTFIDFTLNSSCGDNIKPITMEHLQDFKNSVEPWLPRAIDKYLSWSDRLVFELLYGSLYSFGDKPVDTIGSKVDPAYEHRNIDSSRRKSKKGGKRKHLRRRAPVSRDNANGNCAYDMEMHQAFIPSYVDKMSEKESMKHSDSSAQESATCGAYYRYNGSIKCAPDINTFIEGHLPSQSQGVDESEYKTDQHREHVCHSKKVTEAEDSFVKDENSIIEHYNSLSIHSGVASRADNILIPGDSRGEKGIQYHRKSGYSTKGTSQKDRLVITQSFSKETHLDLEENIVEEGSKTLEGVDLNISTESDNVVSHRSSEFTKDVKPKE